MSNVDCSFAQSGFATTEAPIKFYAAFSPMSMITMNQKFSYQSLVQIFPMTENLHGSSLVMIVLTLITDNLENDMRKMTN